MKIARITPAGLAGMGISVALLWGCLICERVIVRHASFERARALYNIQQLRHVPLRPIQTPLGPAPLHPASTQIRIYKSI